MIRKRDGSDMDAEADLECIGRSGEAENYNLPDAHLSRIIYNKRDKNFGKIGIGWTLFGILLK